MLDIKNPEIIVLLAQCRTKPQQQQVEHIKMPPVKLLVNLAMQDILYDPQTSGGLLFAIPAAEAQSCLTRLKQTVPDAAVIGYVTEKEDFSIILE